MPQPYSLDLRTRVGAAAQHQTYAEVAARFAVSASTVSRWCRRAHAPSRRGAHARAQVGRAASTAAAADHPPPRRISGRP